jgi:hypothetical protein
MCAFWQEISADPLTIVVDADLDSLTRAAPGIFAAILPGICPSQKSRTHPALREKLSRQAAFSRP